MSPATLTDTEATAAALSAADDLFYRQGVDAVSMSEVRDASGVSLRRLYKLFPQKTDLVAEWLRYRHVTWTDGFRSQIEVRLDAGEPVIDAVFAALSQWMTDTKFRGCGFINTHAATDLTDEHRSIIRDHKESLAVLLDQYLTTSTAALDGPTLAVIVDGAIVQASIFASTEAITLAHAAARSMTRASMTRASMTRASMTLHVSSKSTQLNNVRTHDND